MSEQRVDIPNHANWPTNTLDGLCDLISRGKGPRYVESSNVSAIGQRCITDTGFDASLSRPHDEKSMDGHLVPVSGDVLLNSTGTGTIGRSSVFDGHGQFIVDSHVTVLRPRKREADPKWLNELLRNPRLQRHLEANCYTGSTNQLELSRSQLMKTSVPTPTYDEQRLIARTLDTLDTQIQKTEALIAKLEKVEEGLLHDLLTRGIDEKGRLRPSPVQAPELYKESPLGLIPREWEVRKGIDCVSIHNPSRRLDENSCSPDGDTPIINQSSSGFLGWTNLSPDLDSSSDNPFVTFANHTCAVRWVDFPCSAIQNVFFLKGREGIAIKYLYYVLDGKIPMQSYQGHWPLFKESWIQIPSHQEQNRISKSLEDLFRKIGCEYLALEKLVTEKSGLMDDLLTGRVRVTPLLDQTQTTTPA